MCTAPVTLRMHTRAVLAQESLCPPGMFHYRCSARCCLRPRGLVSHSPLAWTDAWLARRSTRSAVSQTVPFSGLCVRCRASTLHLAEHPLPSQRFRAVGSTLPGKASVMPRTLETVVKTPGLSSPCTMECGEGLLPAFGLSFTPHIERKTRPDLRLRPHPVDTLLHLAIAPVAPLHCI